MLNRFNKLGNPPRLMQGPAGLASPILLRYLKVASDLRILFGELGDSRVSEIGVGFGGQLSVLHKLSNVQMVTLYDLPPVLKLEEQRLEEMHCSFSAIDFVSAIDDFALLGADLVISNYAFSELTRENRDIYLEKSISQSPRGYLTWNSQSEEGYSVEDLLPIIPGSAAIPEVPLTAKKNTVIAWGQGKGQDKSLSDRTAAATGAV